MEWNEIVDKKDIDNLLKEFCYFHDSCLVSLNYNSGAFVDNNGSMGFGVPEERELHIFFQSQRVKRVLVLNFSKVKTFHIAVWQDNYFCDIFDCYLNFHNDLVKGSDDNLIVWADSESFNLQEKFERYILNEPMNRYVISGSLKWRFI